MALVKDIGSSEFESEVLQSRQPVVVDFWAEWCGPCLQLGPVVDALAADLQGQVRFVRLNVDQYPHSSMAYGVQSIPTLIAFKEGQPVGRLVGYMPKEHIRHQLEHMLAEVVPAKVA